MKAALNGPDRWNYRIRKLVLRDGIVVDANEHFAAISTDIDYMTSSKCTECQGFHEVPQCASVCPVDYCVADEEYVETAHQLLAKKTLLHT